MKNKFNKELIKGLAYYAIGFAISWLTYIIFGWEYKHAPGLHHIIAILFLLGGAASILYYSALTVAGLKSKVNFGLLTVHSLIIIAFVLYVFISK